MDRCRNSLIVYGDDSGVRSRCQKFLQDFPLGDVKNISYIVKILTRLFEHLLNIQKELVTVILSKYTKNEKYNL